MNVSNTPSNTRALYTAPDGGKIYGSGIHTKEDFMELMMANRPSPEKLRYNGSKERVPMTNAQVTELAKKYDPTNMTQEQYQEFLDDLVSMGRISQVEKEIMHYVKGALRIGYVDEEGDYVSSSGYVHSCSSDASPEEEAFLQKYGSWGIHLGCDGDLRKTLQMLSKYEVADCSSGDAQHNRELQKSIRQEKERLKVMTTVVENIMKRRGELGLTSGKAEASEQTEKPGLMERATEPGGAFWLDLRNTIIESAREKQERAAEDAKIELLDLILESMTGDEDSRRDAAAQLRVRAVVNPEDIAALAAKYDPSNMTGEQYQEFLQDLEELGAITADDHTRMGNYCLTMWVTSYTDSSGREVKLTREESEARFGKSGDSLSIVDGDLMKMLRSMWKSRPGERGRLEILLDIVEQIRLGGETIPAASSL